MIILIIFSLLIPLGSTPDLMPAPWSEALTGVTGGFEPVVEGTASVHGTPALLSLLMVVVFIKPVLQVKGL